MPWSISNMQNANFNVAPADGTTEQSTGAAPTAGSLFVSPAVVSYTPDCNLAIESSEQESVTVKGIQNFFCARLSDADAVKVLSGVSFAGVTFYESQGKRAELNNQLLCNWSGDATRSADALAVLAAAVAGATEDDEIMSSDRSADSQARTIKKYLKEELASAFQAAFQGFTLNLGADASNVDGATSGLNGSGVTTAAAGDGGATATGQASNPDPAGSGVTMISGAVKDQGADADATVAINTIQLNAFSVDVDVSGGAAADALVAQTATPALNSLWLQIPQATLDLYRTVTSGVTSAEMNTNALPMACGDSLVFIFDIDVAASNALEAPTSGSALPAPNADSYTYSLDLARRRVALRLVLGDSAPGSALPGMPAPPA
jgi:hypothetical protein